MILAQIGKCDKHFADGELSEILSFEGELEWHELISDPRADEDFERIYQRDLLRKILERVKLSRREKEAVTLFLEGTSFKLAARKNGVHRQVFVHAFRSAIAKMRKAAAELGELQPSMPSSSKATKCSEPFGVQ